MWKASVCTVIFMFYQICHLASRWFEPSSYEAALIDDICREKAWYFTYIFTVSQRMLVILFFLPRIKWHSRATGRPGWSGHTSSRAPTKMFILKRSAVCETHHWSCLITLSKLNGLISRITKPSQLTFHMWMGSSTADFIQQYVTYNQNNRS